MGDLPTFKMKNTLMRKFAVDQIFLAPTYFHSKNRSAVNISSVLMEVPRCTLSVEIERPLPLSIPPPFSHAIKTTGGGVSGSAPMIEAEDRVNHVF
jgi:hypothetical protein